jgi:hypothetical protein
VALVVGVSTYADPALSSLPGSRSVAVHTSFMIRPEMRTDLIGSEDLTCPKSGLAKMAVAISAPAAKWIAPLI